MNLVCREVTRPSGWSTGVSGLKSSLNTATLSPEKKIEEGAFSDCFWGKGAAVHRLFEIPHSKPCSLSHSVLFLAFLCGGREITGQGPVPHVSDFNFAIRPLITEFLTVQRAFGGYGPCSYLWTGSQSLSLLFLCFLLRVSQYMWLKTSSPVPHLWKKSSSVREARFVLS